jgi:chromate reductase
MTSTVRILLMSGSLRAGSTNTALLLTAKAVAPANVDAVLYSGLNDLPHFNPDRDVEPLHPAVVVLRSSVQAADAVLFSTPEYAGALPGAFKNALDWLVGGTGMDRMPVAWVNISSVAAPTGGSDAHESLRKVLGYLNANIIEDACVRIPMQRSDIGFDGLIPNPAVRQQIAEVLAMLLASDPSVPLAAGERKETSFL